MSTETFEQYCGRETIRQTLRGHRVPHVNQHVAHAQWLQQARRVWMSSSSGTAPPALAEKVCGTEDGGGFSGVFPMPARQTMLQNAALLRTPPPNTRIDAAARDASSPLTFPPQQEVARLVQCIELLLRLCFLDPSNRSILSSLLALRPEITHLQESRTLGEGPNQHPHVHTLYELLSFRRLMRSWSQLPQDKRVVCVATSLVIARAYVSDAFAAFQKALEESMDVTRANPSRLMDLAVRAAVDVPWQYSETAVAIRSIYPSGAEPTAVAKHMAPEGNQGVEQESDDPIEDCDVVEVAAVPDAASVSQLPAKQYGLMSWHATTVQKAKRDDSPDQRLGDILVHGTVLSEPAAAETRKKVRIESPAAPANTTTPARPVATATSKAVAAASAAPKHPVAVPQQQVRATAAHPYPCPSKYHARFSSDDKHASRECAYCSVCHMMEFLFNGCKATCCWRHEPTERKVKLHLGKHPSIVKVALRRLEDWSSGRNPDPIDI